MVKYLQVDHPAKLQLNMTNLFDTEEKRESALVTFQGGISTPFWILMVQMLEADMTTLKELILTGVDKEGNPTSEDKLDKLRDCLKIYQEISDTPKIMIEKLTHVEPEEITLDPYPTLKKERNKLNG